MKLEYEPEQEKQEVEEVIMEDLQEPEGPGELLIEKQEFTFSPEPKVQ